VKQSRSSSLFVFVVAGGFVVASIAGVPLVGKGSSSWSPVVSAWCSLLDVFLLLENMLFKWLDSGKYWERVLLKQVDSEGEDAVVVAGGLWLSQEVMYHTGYGVIQNTDKVIMLVTRNPMHFTVVNGEKCILNGTFVLKFVFKMIFSPLEALLDDNADEFC
ncbi:LOW QUALITY PROTEIN: hypothetical protein V2J09_021732, partial [Rumex salicifolius]